MENTNGIFGIKCSEMVWMDMDSMEVSYNYHNDVLL